MLRDALDRKFRQRRTQQRGCPAAGADDRRIHPQRALGRRDRNAVAARLDALHRRVEAQHRAGGLGDAQLIFHDAFERKHAGAGIPEADHSRRHREPRPSLPQLGRIVDRVRHRAIQRRAQRSGDVILVRMSDEEPAAGREVLATRRLREVCPEPLRAYDQRQVRRAFPGRRARDARLAVRGTDAMRRTPAVESDDRGARPREVQGRRTADGAQSDDGDAGAAHAAQATDSGTCTSGPPHTPVLGTCARRRNPRGSASTDSGRRCSTPAIR